MSNTITLTTYVSETKKIKTNACGSFFVTVYFDSDDLQPKGIIVKVGKGSSCLNTIMSVLGSTLGKILEEEGFIAMMSYLKNNQCSEPIIEGGRKTATSCLNAIYNYIDEVRHSFLNEKILDLAERL